MEQKSMKTLIIGGGRGCLSLLDLTAGSFLTEMSFDVFAVADSNEYAPGMLYAKDLSLESHTDYHIPMDNPGLELIIELTGEQAVLDDIHKCIRSGIRLIDHTVAHLFWEILNVREEQAWQLKELKRLEAKVEEERQFLKSVFNSNNDLAVVLDKDLTILKANSKFLHFVMMNERDVIGKRCYEVINHSMLDCNKEEQTEILNEIMRTGNSITIVRRTPPPNESHWEVTRTPIKNQKGEIFAILGSWHKITEKVKLKREIESQEQRFQSFINSAKDWISIKDTDGKYIIVNPVTAMAFDRKAKDFIGRKPEELFPEKLAKTVNFHDNEVVRKKQAISYEEIIPIHGQNHHFNTIRFPLTDYSGEIIGVCTIAREITKEIRLQEQLVQSEKLAALGKLAAGVAHEINNPLTGILAYAEDLYEEYPDQKFLTDDLKVIIRETLRCRDIVRNLLDFARQDKPNFELKNPNGVIQNCLALITRLPQFKDITIEKRISGEVPEISIDPHQLQQVLLNMMINAADAMKFRGRIIIASIIDPKKRSCEISITDSGPGIPENLIDKIFEPFFSTKSTNGLGLAVSWGIIERHRGTIEIDTADSGGAIFRIFLPIEE
jgi:two-component system, NtrC family, sensor kinase